MGHYELMDGWVTWCLLSPRLFAYVNLYIPSQSHISLPPPGVTLPNVRHACLRPPLPLVASRPSRPLPHLDPLGRPGGEARSTDAPTTATVPPPPHQCLPLPVPAAAAALPPPPAPGLPLAAREGRRGRRRRRWRRPLRAHPTASSPPHGTAQHPARTQHRRSAGGQLQWGGAGRRPGEGGLPTLGAQRGGADHEWDGPQEHYQEHLRPHDWALASGRRVRRRHRPRGHRPNPGLHLSPDPHPHPGSPRWLLHDHGCQGRALFWGEAFNRKKNKFKKSLTHFFIELHPKQFCEKMILNALPSLWGQRNQSGCAEQVWKSFAMFNEKP